MRFTKTKAFLKRYKKLPVDIQKQVNKQILHISEDFYHPALNTKKKSGSRVWEFRVSKGYRMTAEKIHDEIILHTVGQHDEGLGKK